MSLSPVRLGCVEECLCEILAQIPPKTRRRAWDPPGCIATVQNTLRPPSTEWPLPGQDFWPRPRSDPWSRPLERLDEERDGPRDDSTLFSRATAPAMQWCARICMAAGISEMERAANGAMALSVVVRVSALRVFRGASRSGTTRLSSRARHRVRNACRADFWDFD